MNDRETKELTVGSRSFLVKTYATAREAHEIKQAYFKGTKLEVVGETPKISEFNPGVQFDVSLEMIRQMVVSMDGSAERIPERCEALPSDEFDELVNALDEIVSKKKS